MAVAAAANGTTATVTSARRPTGGTARRRPLDPLASTTPSSAYLTPAVAAIPATAGVASGFPVTRSLRAISAPSPALTPIPNLTPSPTLSRSPALPPGRTRASLQHASRFSSHVRASAMASNGSGGTGGAAAAAAADAPVAATDVPILTAEQVLAALRRRHEDANGDNGGPAATATAMRAMYSSVTGGITTDVAAMVLPLDDHMCHRGHAVFDTATIVDGLMYELDAHVDRFFSSAHSARITPLFDKDRVKAIVLATAAVGGVRNGHMRYWMSAGPGGFAISPSECPTSALYVVALADPLPSPPFNGICAITATVAMKSAQMGTMKSVNYLPNALAKMEAEEKDAGISIWVDEEGFVGEAPTMNVAFVSDDDYLLVPSFERILAGCTVRRLMVLADSLTQDGPHRQLPGQPPVHGPLLRGVRFGRVAAADVRASAKEMFVCSSGAKVDPIVEWDGKPIGNGRPGPVSAALWALLQEDHASGPVVPIPFKDFGSC